MVDGLMRLMEAPMPDLVPVNLGNPQEYRIVDLIGHIIAATGISPGIVHEPLPTDDPRRRRPDIGRARSLLGWEPRISLEEGLRITCAFFAEELGAELLTAGESLSRFGVAAE